MRPLNEKATKVMNRLVRDLGSKEEDKIAARFDRTNGYLPVCVERVGSLGPGTDIFSVAHYFVQNGDLMADPEMEFMRTSKGEFYPMSYKLDSMGIYWVSIEPEEGAVAGWSLSVKKKMQDEQADFANGWMENIEEQQDIFNSKLDEERPTRLT